MLKADEVSKGSLGLAIKRSWWKILLISLFIAAVICVILLQLSPRYVSESRILISPITSYQDPAAPRRQDPSRLIDKASILSQIQVILSRDTLAQVIDDVGLMEDEKFQKDLSRKILVRLNNTLPTNLSKDKKNDEQTKRERTIDQILKNLQVVSLAESRVIGVRYHSPDQMRAAQIANSVAKAYINWQRSEKVIQNQEDSVRLSFLIKDLKKEVEQSEADVAKYRAQKGIFKSSSTNVTLSQQQLTELNRRIIDARERRAGTEIRAQLIREMLEREGEVVSAPDSMRSQLIQRLFEQKTRIKRTTAELSATLLASHPRIKQLRAELAGINQQIRSEMKRIVQSAENDAKIALAREKSLQKSLNELKNQSTQNDGDEIQLRALEREAKTNRELLNTYLTRYRDAEARKGSAIAPAYASIISKAHIPTEPYFPKVLPFTLLAFLITFLIGLGLLIILTIMKTPNEEPSQSTA